MSVRWQWWDWTNYFHQVLIWPCSIVHCLKLLLLLYLQLKMSRALATARFKPEDLDSEEASSFMENLDAFLAEEKTRAQQRIRTCEALVNDPNLTSSSVKDGIALSALSLGASEKSQQKKSCRSPINRRNPKTTHGAVFLSVRTTLNPIV